MNRVQTLVSQNIKTHRMRRDLTQSELARATGLSQSFLVQLEKGTRFPSPESIERICIVLEIEPFELFLEKSAGSGVIRETGCHGMAIRLQERLAETIQEVLEESFHG